MATFRLKDCSTETIDRAIGSVAAQSGEPDRAFVARVFKIAAIAKLELERAHGESLRAMTAGR